jgi:hypothetical protein
MKVRQEDDRVAGKPFLAVMAAVLVVTAIGVLVAWLIEDCRADALGPRAEPAPLMQVHRIPDQIGWMQLRLFDEEAPSLRLRVPQEQRLHGYGWVSREQGVIHIPIERAMELYLRERRDQAGAMPPDDPMQPEDQTGAMPPDDPMQPGQVPRPEEVQ